jgi:hypothetical protein
MSRLDQQNDQLNNNNNNNAGTHETVKLCTRDNILDYIKQYYNPTNSFLSISGNFDEKETLNLINQKFGNWASSDELPAAYTEPEYVGGDVTLSNSNTNIGKIKYIGGNLNLQDSEIESLSNLESVGGVLYLKGNLKDLGKLKKVGRLDIISCNINFTLGSLEEIEDVLNIQNFSVDIDFGNLKTIGGSLYANNTIITDLKKQGTEFKKNMLNNKINILCREDHMFNRNIGMNKLI